jgi:hypothetical protein
MLFSHQFSTTKLGAQKETQTFCYEPFFVPFLRFGFENQIKSPNPIFGIDTFRISCFKRLSPNSCSKNVKLFCSKTEAHLFFLGNSSSSSSKDRTQNTINIQN